MNINEKTALCEIMQKTDRVSAMLICIHGEKEGEIYGNILNCYLKSPVAFQNLGDLILKLDEMCNWLRTPQYSMEPRFLNKEIEKKYWERVDMKKFEQIKSEFKCLNTSQIFSQVVKAQKTLLVKIEFRLQASLQGHVIGKITKGRYIGFRSALELMRMIKEM